jgi:hypothetical protein
VTGITESTYALLASCVDVEQLVEHNGTEINVFTPLIFSVELVDTFEANELMTEVEKLASLPKLNASSFNVSKLAGADETKFDIAESTYDLLASCVDIVGLVEHMGIVLKVLSAVIVCIAFHYTSGDNTR